MHAGVPDLLRCALCPVAAESDPPVDLHPGLGNHAPVRAGIPLHGPRGEGGSGAAAAGFRAARAHRRGGRRGADDRKGNLREPVPRDGAGRVHRRRPREDRHPDPGSEGLWGTRADRGPLRKISDRRDHYRDPVRVSVGGPAHRRALPRGIRHVPDSAGGGGPDRREGQRARAAEPGPGRPAGPRPGRAGRRPSAAPRHRAHGDGDRGGGFDRLGAVPPAGPAVAREAPPLRDRGEPPVLLRVGDAADVPDPGPDHPDRRCAGPLPGE